MYPEAITPSVHHPLPLASPEPITYRHQGAHEDAHRRQLRGHALHAADLAHALPLHVAATHNHWGTGDGEGKGLGTGAPAAQRLLSSQLIDDLGHTCIFMCGGGRLRLCMQCLCALYPVPPPAPQWSPRELQAHSALTLPRTRSCRVPALWLTTTGTACSRGSTQCRARVR